MLSFDYSGILIHAHQIKILFQLAILKVNIISFFKRFIFHLSTALYSDQIAQNIFHKTTQVDCLIVCFQCMIRVGDMCSTWGATNIDTCVKEFVKGI